MQVTVLEHRPPQTVSKSQQQMMCSAKPATTNQQQVKSVAVSLSCAQLYVHLYPGYSEKATSVLSVSPNVQMCHSLT
jgi:hypothetical protein